MLKIGGLKLSPTIEYGLYILLLLGCIFLLYRHFYSRPTVEPVLMLELDSGLSLPDLELDYGK